MQSPVLSFTTFSWRPGIWTVPILLLLMGASAGSTVQAQLSGEAMIGSPFGVASVTLPVPNVDQAQLPLEIGQLVTEANGRVLYPVFSNGGLRKALGEGRVNRVQVHFLFRGAEPLQLTVSTPTRQTIRLIPSREKERLFQRGLRRWWREYHAMVRRQMEAGDYAPVVQTYLTAMLGRRLQLNPPLLARQQEADDNETQRTLKLLLGLEGLRLAELKRTTSAAGIDLGPADLPVPSQPEWLPTQLDEDLSAIKVEDLARHVPANCYYLRFGRFSHYVWFSRLLAENGGDLGRMVQRRGFASNDNEKMQQQLALKQSLLGEVLGEQFISDIALIGRDLYLQEGAAIGVLFEARNGLFGIELNRQRSAALAQFKDQGAKLEKLTVQGKSVSFLSTPDNRLRSFYVVDGKYHLVTTSRSIVESFLQVAQDGLALSETPEFRLARRDFPLERKDTLFAFFSTEFFAGLVGPHYQIELQRRLQAATDLQLVSLASAAARNEGLADPSLDELSAYGFLPRGFGARVDGSGPIVTQQLTFNSLRGPQGHFTPIPDVTVDGVTAREQRQYLDKAAYYQANWQQLDPLMVVVNKQDGKSGREKVALEARVAPFHDSKYRWLTSSLGNATPQIVRPTTESVIWAQASLRGGLVSPTVPPHLMFVGLIDAVPGTDLKPEGLFEIYQTLRTTPGFLGAWPQPGFLDQLPFGLGGDVDPWGYSKYPLGLWRWQGRGFSVVSFNKSDLVNASQQLEVLDSETPAHFRVSVGDLSQARFSAWLNQLNYQQSRGTSIGNARLMHVVSQQLGIPAAEAKAFCERLLNAELVCTLGGRYERVTDEGRAEYWQSDAWAAGRSDDYQSPLLAWFRGLEATLIRSPQGVVLQAELEMQR